MSDIEKLRKQLRDLTDLYDAEKERADNAQQTLSDFWRREPLVHLLWSEIILLRKLLETHYGKSSAVLDLPTQRASDRGKPAAFGHREKLTIVTLKTMNDKNLNIDAAIAASGQSPTKTLQQQVAQREQPLNGNNDVVSAQLQEAQQRVAQLEVQLGQMQSHYSNEIQRLQSAQSQFSPQQQQSQQHQPISGDANNNIPPPSDLPPPPPMDGDVPPAPSPDGAAQGATPSSTSAIPPAPVLPGFVGKGGAAVAAAPSGGATTVPGSSLPMPPVLPGFTAKYPGQGGAPAASSGGGYAAQQAAAAPPVDPGPQPTKQAIKPTKKMKALHWKPIITGEKGKQSDAAKNSIWAQIDQVYATALRDISVMDFEEKFTSAPPKAKAQGAQDPDAAAKAAREANKPQRLLDPNRHNQLSIMLSKMPALPEMKKALLALDSTVLKPEHIESMHKNMFTTEDIDTVKSSGLPKEKLMAPEQWILEMSTIPQLAARIECWRFSQVFNDEYVAVVRPLARLETACQEIRSSQLLRKFFTYVLVIGNHLNGGTARGRADGFDIESLGKLFRIKDAEGTGTLIDYLVTFMQTKFGQDVIANLRAELATLPEVKTSSLRTIAGEAKKLLGKINLTLKMQSLVLAQNIPGDKFEQILGSFAADAEHKVKALDSRATTALKAFYDLVKYMEPNLEQGQIDKVQSEEWFPLIEEFVNGLVQTQQNQIKKKEAAEREAKAAANMAALQAKAGKKPGDPMSPAPPGQELGENGFPKLRSAADRPQPTSPGMDPANELQGGFPKLRSAADRPQNQPTSPNPANELQGGFPKLRSAAHRPQNQQQPSANPANELQGGFPKLRSANQGPASPVQPKQQEPGFVMPTLKKTETKTAPIVQDVPASDFDNVKRPTAKSNVFLKAQNKLPVNTAVKQQQQVMQQKQMELPPPPEHCFGDDDDDSEPDDDFFRNLDLPPPPPDDSD